MDPKRSEHIDLREHVLVPTATTTDPGELGAARPRLRMPGSQVPGMAIAVAVIPSAVFCVVLFAGLWESVDLLMVVLPIAGGFLAGLVNTRLGGSRASTLLTMLFAAMATAVAVGAAALLGTFFTIFGSF